MVQKLRGKVAVSRKGVYVV